MQDSNTNALLDQELERLAEIVADDPIFAKKLVSALAVELDKKFGWRQGWMEDKMDELNEKLDGITQKLGDHDRRFDTLEHNFTVLGEKLVSMEKKEETTA